ncbi:hypothetical protein CC86DRAFT_333923 [Ophiobolus disseminans]|uniref:DRBM domain-containing protein n=1 Tax=Ophiobolus disseminans TaxID=1469910 RepID=A0A6A6ZJE3_9PLEO|nr:hypothetical protein CC86DRAFT_333923 [Ophiobolus disseminans]
MYAPGDNLRKSLLVPKSLDPTSNPAAKSLFDLAKENAKMSNMEIDSLPPTHAGLDAAPAPTKLDGVFTMEEFMNGPGAQHVDQAAKSTSTSAKVKKAAPAPKLGGGPIAIGARTSKYTQDLHEKYQKLGIPQPVFNFHGSSDRGWSGDVSFPGLHDDLQGVTNNGNFHPSKQEAKERLSERALVILERLEKEGTVKKVDVHSARVSKHTVALHDKCQKLGITPFFSYAGSTDQGWSATVAFPGFAELLADIKDDKHHPNKSEAKKAVCKQALEAVEAAEQQGERFGKAAKGPAQQPPKEKEGPGPNYIGQLLEFQRATKSPQPTYSDYAVGSQFTCTVTIEDEGTFGSLEARYTSKKTARREAARAAVEHFKSAGRWPEDFSDLGGIKKKKKKTANPSGLPELISSSSSDSRAASVTSAGASASAGSYPQQVARLAHILSLPTPEWKYTPSPLDRDFHTVHCFFPGGGAHAGPIGEVRNVFGKKKAKEECARLTLEYLNEVHALRIAYGQQILEGIGGAENVLEGALGRPSEGEEEVVQAKRQFEEMGGESSDEGGFEDAMEDLMA